MKKQNEPTLKKPYIVCLLAGLCCLLWGSAFAFIKIGYNALSIENSDFQSQILFAGIRFAVAGLIVILFGSLMSKRFLAPKKSSLAKIFVLSLLQTVIQYIFFYIGLANASGTKSSVINSVSVFFTVILSAIIFKSDRLDIKKAVGCIIGFIGVVIINFSDLNGISKGFDFAFKFNGEGFIIISSLAYAFACICIKRFGESENTVMLSGWQFLLGGIILIVLGLALDGGIGNISLKGALIIVYLAFVSAAAFTLWGILLKYNDASKVAVYGFMTPVFGCLLSAVLLRETLEQGVFQIIISLLCVCIGIYLVNTNNRQQLNHKNKGV